jgi:hypothetical protein
MLLLQGLILSNALRA